MTKGTAVQTAGINGYDDNGQSVKMLADMLREAFSAGCRLSHTDKQQLLTVCLAFQWRHYPRERMMALCHSLLRGLSAITDNDKVPIESGFSTQNDDVTEPHMTATGIHTVVATAPLEQAQQAHMRRMLQEMLVKFHGDSSPMSEETDELLRHLAVTIEQMSNVMRELSAQRKFSNVSLFSILEQIEIRLRDQEDAIKKAAQESFDRLLVSVNPQTAKAYVQGGSMKFGPFYKAALFDAVCEKYEQLVAYHEKGRLVRDFRAMHKSHLKLFKRKKI